MDDGTDDPFALLVADLYQAAGLSRRRGEQIAKTQGQSQARWQVLSVLSDGPWTVAQAARRLGTVRQAVQRVAHELVQDGLLSARDNPDHRTSPLFVLTEQGEHTLARLTAAAAEDHRVLMEEFTADEVAHVRAALRRLIAAWERA